MGEVETGGQTEVVIPPFPGYRGFEVKMLGRAIGDLDRAAMEILDNADDLAAMLAFYARVREEWLHLGQTMAAVEARCAGAMPKAKFADPVAGVRAERRQGYRYTWEDRRLLFDVMAAYELEARGGDMGESPETFDADVWKLVDLLLKLGRWEPRSTALQEEFGWTREDVGQYRKGEKTRRTVTVTLGEPGGESDDEPAEDAGAAGPVAGPGDVPEGDGDAPAAEDA